MKSFVSRTGIGIAVAAGVMSVVWTQFVPYGYPWPSFAWAILAGAAVVYVLKASVRPAPSMSDVISGVEGEARTKVSPGSEPVARRTVS
jgi:hypothetical protein